MIGNTIEYIAPEDAIDVENNDYKRIGEVVDAYVKPNSFGGHSRFYIVKCNNEFFHEIVYTDMVKIINTDK